MPLFSTRVLKAHTCNSSIQKSEAGGSQVQGYPLRHNNFEARLAHIRIKEINLHKVDQENQMVPKTAGQCETGGKL